MLAVDVHQVVGHAPQLRQCGHAAVHPGAAFARGVHRAPKQQGVASEVGLTFNTGVKTSVETSFQQPAS